MQIVLASANRHKHQEMTELLKEIPVTLLFGGDFENVIDVEETGSTYEENARIKAEAWARATGLPALADDSGVEAAFLDWAPGIFSARIVEGSDADRVAWLLEQLQGAADRRGRFVASLVLVLPDTKREFCATGICDGRIAEKVSGKGGFGYDPIFIPEGYESTFGELSADIKMRESHRAKAAKKMAQILRSML